MKNKRATEEILAALHGAVADTLLGKIQDGTATPAEINAAIKFLQNNNIQGTIEPESTESKLLKALPTFDQMVDDFEE